MDRPDSARVSASRAEACAMVVLAASARVISLSSSGLPNPRQSSEPAGSAVASAVAWSKRTGVAMSGGSS